VAQRNRPSREPKQGNRSGRHPEAERVKVRFTDPALADLQVMARKADPQVVRAALKKCLMLERDPKAGEPLKGGLVGYRKLVVGDRDWRIVWRVTYDDTGDVIVDVAEVWAVGARNSDDVYDEMARRVRDLRSDPHTVPLADAIDALGKLARGLKAPQELDDEELPRWLMSVLTTVVGMPAAEVQHLSVEEATRVWDAYKRKPR
jgi:mRNA interferase RelE/StbE